MTLPTARSAMTASISRRSRSRISAVPSAWFCRTSTYSPARSWRISATASSDATDEECIAAAKLANADGFIRMLPQGYDTVLSGDGSGLSQGQRQLISIARAAVADPPGDDSRRSDVLHRYPHGGASCRRGMDALMKGRTVFVIAHRLSTVQNSDVIMVLDHGHIIERGSHRRAASRRRAPTTASTPAHSNWNK